MPAVFAVAAAAWAGETITTAMALSALLEVVSFADTIVVGPSTESPK